METPQELPATEEAKPTSPDASLLIEKIKREKMIRSQQLELQKAKMELEGRIPQEVEKVNQTWKQRLQDNFLDVAREAGLTHEQLANMIMTHNPQDQKFYEQESKIKALEAKLDAFANSSKKSETDAVSNAQAQLRKEVATLAKARPDDFEMLSKAGEDGQKRVVEHMMKKFEEEGTYPTLEEAATAIEAEILEALLPFAETKKVRAKLTPEQVALVKEITKSSPTLTREATQVSSSKLTNKERRERAILAAQGKLLE